MEGLKASFDQDGYVFVKEFLNPAESRELNQQLSAFIKNIVPDMPENHAFYEDRKDPSSLKQLFRMADYDSFFEKLLSGPKFNGLAETLLGEKTAKGNVEYFNKPPGMSTPTPPHQDAYYFMLTPPQAITFWIPLEDVDEENGCLRYVKGSHLKGMRRHGKNPILGFSQTITDFGTPEDLENEVAVPANVGDILAHHGMTIHRADGNRSATRSRRVVGLVYFGVSAKEDIEAKKAYQETLRKERASQV